MKHKHEVDCECCRDGMEAVLEREKKMIEEYGWYIHMVADDDSCPFGMNIHTHGVAEKFNHPDLQICFPISKDLALGIMHAAVHCIEKGEVFAPGGRASNILEGFDVQFVEAWETGRRVIRLFLPDKDNEVKNEYAEQLENLNNEENS